MFVNKRLLKEGDILTVEAEDEQQMMAALFENSEEQESQEE